jgi:Ser/Thr protein kinase RdoA (MazF antagonist)
MCSRVAVVFCLLVEAVRLKLARPLKSRFQREFDAALAGLRTAAREQPVPTAAFTAAASELRLTAQRAVAGTRPASAKAVAKRAGELVATLQRAELPALPAARPLAAAIRKADVIGAVLPALAPRLGPLVRRLAAEQPADARGVPAHGDFHVDQLLLTADGVAVIDFDGLCRAAPALDLASYAADVVRGRDADVDGVHAVLEPLLEGYGSRPEALDWHLSVAILGRAAHPFQRQLPGWPERVERMVAAAEELGP